MLKLLKKILAPQQKEHCGCCGHDEKDAKEKESKDKTDEELVKERLKSLGYL